MNRRQGQNILSGFVILWTALMTVLLGMLVLATGNLVSPGWSGTLWDGGLSDDAEAQYRQDVLCLLDRHPDGFQNSEIIGYTPMNTFQTEYILNSLWREDKIRKRTVELNANVAQVWLLNHDTEVTCSERG